MKFFKFNLTLMGVILHITTILISLKCCCGNLLLWMCCRIEKWRNLHICQDIGLIFFKFGGGGGYFWMAKSKINNKIFIWCHSDIKKNIKVKYILQKMHMMSLWHHFLSNFFEKLNLSSSYEGLSPHQFWFNLDQGKQSYRGGQIPPRLRMY